jgi:hypothetical protein
MSGGIFLFKAEPSMANANPKLGPTRGLTLNSQPATCTPGTRFLFNFLLIAN